MARLAGGWVDCHAADRIPHQHCLRRRNGRIHLKSPESIRAFYGPSIYWKVKLAFSVSWLSDHLLTFQ
ncbi:hypothetical protein [Paracoccus niistensis]|uniref:Uncharacterized protein n=1 Tax=Paracoccus niistensis TaxID=632935 RepID=A0ABV6HZY1_9RHOB